MQNGNPPLDSGEHFMTEEEMLTDQERSKRYASTKAEARDTVQGHRVQNNDIYPLVPISTGLRRCTLIPYIIWPKCTNTWRWLRRRRSIAILPSNGSWNTVATIQWSGHSMQLLCLNIISQRWINVLCISHIPNLRYYHRVSTGYDISIPDACSQSLVSGHHQLLNRWAGYIWPLEACF